MTNEVDIDRQIQGDYERWYNSTCDFETALPEETIEFFKRSLMESPPNLHQVHTNKIRNMVSVPVNTLTRMQVGIMVNIILSVSPRCVYDSFEDFLKFHEVFEAIKIEYNTAVDKLNKQLKEKKKRLMELSGVTKKTLHLAK
jgi:hypothetical protein